MSGLEAGSNVAGDVKGKKHAEDVPCLSEHRGRHFKRVLACPRSDSVS